MKILEKDFSTKPVQITARKRTVDRLREYTKGQQLAPKLVDIVSVAIDKWLDEQEGKA